MFTTDREVIAQRPAWPDERHLALVSAELQARRGLVAMSDVLRLRQLIASAAAGEALLFQYGDCAEPVLDDPADYVESFMRLRDAIQLTAASLSSRPIVHIGRIAGQYAKPRSADREQVDGREVYAYRGDMVNSPEPDDRLRIPNPNRLLRAHDCATTVIDRLLAVSAARRHTGPPSTPSCGVRDHDRWLDVYTSHEALILEYERPLIRTDEITRVTYSSSAHMLWVGDRTRSADSAHVALLGSICNPVGIKVGPNLQMNDLLAVVARVNPLNLPGRVTLIVRLGEREVRRTLPRLMRELKKHGTRVAWVCDPMHGNTRRLTDGRKIRLMTEIMSEICSFAEIANDLNLPIAGLHLEASVFADGECVDDESSFPNAPFCQESRSNVAWCDPRLSMRQAVQAVEQFLMQAVDQQVVGLKSPNFHGVQPPGLYHIDGFRGPPSPPPGGGDSISQLN